MEKLGIFWEDSELWNCWQLSTLFFPSVPITWLGKILSTPPPASTTQVLTHLHLPSTLIAIPPVLTSDSSISFSSQSVQYYFYWLQKYFIEPRVADIILKGQKKRTGFHQQLASPEGTLSTRLFRSYHSFGTEWEVLKSFAMLLLQKIIHKVQTQTGRWERTRSSQGNWETMLKHK